MADALHYIVPYHFHLARSLMMETNALNNGLSYGKGATRNTREMLIADRDLFHTLGIPFVPGVIWNAAIS